MLDIARFSDRFRVRRMQDADADAILALCLGNPQFYAYTGSQPSRELILNDLHIAPHGVDASRKYYVGFYDGTAPVAVMDLIEGYPDGERCFIGFFMMHPQLQGKEIGSGIVQSVCAYLGSAGFSAVRLAINKGNPQSTHFWIKNGFSVIRGIERGGEALLIAEKALSAQHSSEQIV